MPIGRGGGVSLVAEDADDEPVPPPESAVETPILVAGDTNEGLPVSSLSDGWVIG